MRVFIGSSQESVERGYVRMLAVWVEQAGHQAVPWTEPDVFLPGDYIFPRLTQLSREVDAAVLVFANDDQVRYRGELKGQPRDNVLIEYGLFAGALGQGKTVVCLGADTKKPSDLEGLITINITQRALAHSQLVDWLRRIQPVEPALPAKPGQVPREDGRRLELRLLERMKKLSIRDPDVDLYIATLLNDAAKAEAATEAGGNPNVPLGQLLERYHPNLAHDRTYLDLLAKLMMEQRQ